MDTVMISAGIRHFITASGGALASYGYGTASDWEQVAGVAVFLFGLGWSFWDKRKK